MKKTFLYFLFLSISFIVGVSKAGAQQVVYDWKHTIPGYNFTALACMATDSSDNVYVGGTIDSLVSFPDTNLYTNEPTGYLAKFDPNGNLIWFRLFPHSTVVLSICFDSEDNLYISGEFKGKVEINDTVFPTYDSDTNFSGMFLAKFNTDAQLIWAKTTGGMFYYSTGFGKLKQMTVDHDDNIIVVGYGIGELEYFDTTLVFTRPLDSAWVTTPFPHWVYFFNYTNYLAKFDKNGQKLWIKDIGDYSQEYYSIATDFSNNILLCGNFAEGVGNDFIIDSIVLTSGVGRNIFIAKYDQNGKVIWAQRAGGEQYYTNKGFDVCADENNSIYLTGRIGGGAIFGDSLYYLADGSAFLTKYSISGNVCWVSVLESQQIQPPSFDYNYGISVKFFNNSIYLCGFFTDSILFNFIKLISTDIRTCMVIKYDINGSIIGASMDSISEHWVTPNEITVNNDSSMYISGNIAYWTGEWIWDMYLGKFSINILNDIQYLSNDERQDYKVYPNPCAAYLHIASHDSNIKCVQLLSSKGALLFAVNCDDPIVEINIADLSAGLYFVRIQNNESVSTTKIIKN